jgi:hypothetical protein
MRGLHCRQALVILLCTLAICTSCRLLPVNNNNLSQQRQHHEDMLQLLLQRRLPTLRLARTPLPRILDHTDQLLEMLLERRGPPLSIPRVGHRLL